jgi:hypothetical protein
MPGYAMSKFTARVDGFKALRSKTLRGSYTVTVPEIHLRIIDLSVHEKNGSRWIGLPAKPQITREGTVRKDDRGKIAYAAVLEFTDKATRSAFSKRVIASLLEFAPTAFDDEAA